MTRDSIQVTRCKDPLLWYADRIDHVFEVLEYDALRNVYLVATSYGRNIVYEEDCESWDVAQACAPVDDTVNHPGHYTSSNIECIQAIEAALSDEAFEGFLLGNTMKYLWRCNHKGKKIEDLNKARWYLSRLIEEME